MDKVSNWNSFYKIHYFGDLLLRSQSVTYDLLFFVRIKVYRNTSHVAKICCRRHVIYGRQESGVSNNHDRHDMITGEIDY